LGQVLDAADLDPEPRLEEEPQQRPHDRVVEMRIEPELVDTVIAGKAVPQKLGDGTDLVRELVAGLVGVGFAAGSAPVLIDLADDVGDLIGRSAGAGFGEWGG